MFGDIFDAGINKEERQFNYGPHSIKLLCVPKENQHIDKWVPLVVWRAAEAFNEELIRPARASQLKSKRVVELGSGTGICGLLVAKISGSTTLLTDGSEDSVEALQESILLNDFEKDQRVESVLLQWGDIEGANQLVSAFGKFDVCVATDVIYEAAAVKPLLTSARELLSDDGVFYLANHRFRFHGLKQEIESHLKKFPFILSEFIRIGEYVDLYVFRRLR